MSGLPRGRMAEFHNPLENNSEEMFKLGPITFKTGKVYFWFGPSLSGKTWLCCWFARKLAKMGERVIYIDTEEKSSEWFKKWNDNGLLTGEEAENIKVKYLTKYDEFKEFLGGKEEENEEKFHFTLSNLKEVVKEMNPRAVVIDSIIAPFEGEVTNPKARSARIFEIMKHLGAMDVIGMVTSEDYDHPKYRYKGGPGLQRHSNHKIELMKKKKKDNGSKLMPRERILTLDEVRQFVITKEGGEVRVTKK